MTADKRIKSLELATQNLAVLLEFGQTKGKSFVLPKDGGRTLETILYVMRRVCEEERAALDEFAKGNDRPDPEPF